MVQEKITRYRYGMFETLEDVTDLPVKDDEDLCDYSDYAALEKRCGELEQELCCCTAIREAEKKILIEEIEKNALLRKRLKPIEALWDKGDDYVIANIDDVRTALLTCMDLKEGVK